MEGFRIQVYKSKTSLCQSVSVGQLSWIIGSLVRSSLKIICSDSCGILRVKTLLPLNLHSNRVSFPLCTFLRSFWIFQTVCCELQLFVQSKQLRSQLSQYISISPTPCIYICAIITSILRQSTGTSLKWSKWKNLPWVPIPLGDQTKTENQMPLKGYHKEY